MTPMPEVTIKLELTCDVAEAVAVFQQAIDDFTADLRRLGIHAGIGEPPQCSCGGPWPCPQAKPKEGKQ